MPAIGEVLAERYRLDAVLGQGGMGKVMRAYHLELQKSVAIKFLRPEVLNNEELVARFLREARAADRLENEHVCKVRDVGRDSDGTPYIVMEYMEGSDLRKLVRERGRLPANEIVDLILQACLALAEAHALEIFHRDIKPPNLFLTKRSDGTPLLKVLDFGISKVPAELCDLETTTDKVLGTPMYMAPEQFDREDKRPIDARTDIWALGVVLYELLAGTRPFQGRDIVQLNYAICALPVPPIEAAIPTELKDAVMRCLEKEPGDRFQSVAELVDSLAPHASSPDEVAAIAARVSRTLARGATGKRAAGTTPDEVDSLPTAANVFPLPTQAESVTEELSTGHATPTTLHVSAGEKAKSAADGAETSGRRRLWRTSLAAAIAGLGLGAGVVITLSVLSAGGEKPSQPRGVASANADVHAIDASAPLSTDTVAGPSDAGTPADAASMPGKGGPGASQEAVNVDAAIPPTPRTKEPGPSTRPDKQKKQKKQKKKKKKKPTNKEQGSDDPKRGLNLDSQK